MIIQVMTPTGPVFMDVADDELVLTDVWTFAKPIQGMYVVLTEVATAHAFKPLTLNGALLDLTPGAFVHGVVMDVLADPETTSDPKLDTVPDPNNGLVVCGITRSRTNLKYVIVRSEL